jgi:hypothetical protein
MAARAAPPPPMTNAAALLDLPKRRGAEGGKGVGRERRAERRTAVTAVQSVFVPIWVRQEVVKVGEGEAEEGGGVGKEEEGRRKVVLMQPVARAVGVKTSTKGTPCSLTGWDGWESQRGGKRSGKGRKRLTRRRQARS